MDLTGEEVHAERLNNELSMWSAMSHVTIEEKPGEIDRDSDQKQQHGVRVVHWM